MTPDPKLEQMRLMKKSVLDAVLDSAKTLQPKLSTSDRARVDEYLTSVGDLEKLVASPGMQLPPGMGGPTVGCAVTAITKWSGGCRAAGQPDCPHGMPQPV